MEINENANNALAASIIATSHDKVSAGKVYRYLSTVTSSLGDDMHDANVKPNIFRIGENTGNSGLRDFTVSPYAADCSFDLLSSTVQKIESHAKKSNSLSSGWSRCDLSAIVAILAASVSKYRFSGKLSKEQVCAGRDIKLSSIKSYEMSISASPDTVFIPNELSSYYSPSCMTALIYAATGAGSDVVVDHVVTTGVNRAPSVQIISDLNLAHACVEALSCLADMYAANGAGEIFGLALTVGLHRESTVYGHSDEGAVVRRILRAVRFTKPNGCIVEHSSEVHNLPTADKSFSSISRFVDNMCFQTAGLVAMSDPLMVVNGKAFPTVLTSEDGTDGGVPSIRDALEIMSKLSDMFHEFAKIYVVLIGKMLGMRGNTHIAAQALSAACNQLSCTVDSHLVAKSVAPFYWIEPTGVVKVDCSGTPAHDNLYGYVCRPNQNASHTAFPKHEVKHSMNQVSAVDFEWTTARAVPYLQHLSHHKKDGLANFIPREFESVKLGMCGAESGYYSMNEKLTKGADVSRYLWRRGHSSMIAPAEMVYTGDKFVAFIVNISQGETIMDWEKTHFLEDSKLDTKVNFSVSYLSALDVDEVRDSGVLLNRQRRPGLKAISKSRRRVHASVDLDALFPVVLEKEDEEAEKDPDEAVSIPEEFVDEEEEMPELAAEPMKPPGEQRRDVPPRIFDEGEDVLLEDKEGEELIGDETISARKEIKSGRREATNPPPTEALAPASSSKKRTKKQASVKP